MWRIIAAVVIFFGVVPFGGLRFVKDNIPGVEKLYWWAFVLIVALIEVSIVWFWWLVELRVQQQSAEERSRNQIRPTRQIFSPGFESLPDQVRMPVNRDVLEVETPISAEYKLRDATIFVLSDMRITNKTNKTLDMRLFLMFEKKTDNPPQASLTSTPMASPTPLLELGLTAQFGDLFPMPIVIGGERTVIGTAVFVSDIRSVRESYNDNSKAYELWTLKLLDYNSQMAYYHEVSSPKIIEMDEEG